MRPAIAMALALVALAPGCSRRADLASGATAQSVSFGGAERSYLVHAGASAPGGGKRALLLVLHGAGGNAPSIERRVGGTFDGIADHEGVVVVYPEAVGDGWNDGWQSSRTADDVGFLAGLIDAVSKAYDVDPKRVYAAGMSNGASMAYRLACEREGLAAIATVAGGMADAVAAHCKDGRAVSVLAMHGTEDPIVPLGDKLRGNVAQWAARDACAGTPDVSYAPDIDEHDGARARIERYPGCKDGSGVTFYQIDGGGHTWPGSEALRPVSQVGSTCRDFDAGAVIWEFFRAHPSP
jgi:polyhydroxybutyrate depolymerase